MQKGLGFALLGLGVVGMTWWGATHQAPRMEAEIAAGAMAAMQDSRHGAEVVVSGRDLTITGILDSDAEQEALMAALRDVPGRRVVRSDAEVLETVDPFALTVTKSAGALRGSGHVPHASVQKALAGEGVDMGGVTLASGAPEGFGAAMAAGVAALGAMESGTAAVEGETLTVTGVALGPDEAAAAEAALADLPEGYDLVFTPELLDDGTPFRLSATWDGAALTGTGKLPEGSAATLTEAAPAALTEDMAEAKVGAGETDWTELAAASLASLGLMDQGQLEIMDWDVSLTGIVDDPQKRAEIEALMAGLPDGVQPVLQLGTSDPGEVGFALNYDAGAGMTGAGHVPEAMGVDGLLAALDLETVGGEIATTSATMDGLEAQLSALAPFLAEMERAEITVTDGQLSVSGAAMAGIDPENLAARLSVALGIDAPALEQGTAPQDGTTRNNAATGQTEVAYAGYWLPRPDFEPTAAACNDEAKAVVSDGGIYFVTGSADLDPVSLRTVKNVAGLVLHCVTGAAGRVIIGGHTDSQGDDLANYTLSVARAKAVREVLLQRGLPARQMQAVGYGETEPVASNVNEEGRALNRRTTFDWAE